MLTIRDAQFDALREARFERWMTEHLERYLPTHLSGLAPDEIRRRIRAASTRARHYGFTATADRCRYIDLSFVLGANFDRNAGLPWAAEILTDARVTLPEMRMDLLYEAVADYLDGEPPDSASDDDDEEEDEGDE